MNKGEQKHREISRNIMVRADKNPLQRTDCSCFGLLHTELDCAIVVRLALFAKCGFEE